jgi:flavin reductase (DIM6/NTAB) family NADH-FMN oxidoreductase RutF
VGGNLSIPELPEGIVAVLATVGEAGPVAIPVSALLRSGPDRLLFALAGTRASVARLRADPRAAASLNGPRMSLCVEGVARLAADPLPGAERMVAFELAAHRIRDARGPATEVDEGIRWRWTSEEAAERHAAVMAALADLSRGRGRPST